MLGFSPLSSTPLSDFGDFDYIIRGYSNVPIDLATIADGKLRIDGRSNITVSITSTGFLRVGRRIFPSKKVFATADSREYVYARKGTTRIIVERIPKAIRTK